MTSASAKIFSARATKWALPTSLLALAASAAGCFGDRGGPPASAGGAVASGGQTTGGAASGGAGTTGGVATSGGASSGGTPSVGGGNLGGAVETVECAGPLPAEERGEAPHSLLVHAGASWGDLPHFWSTYGVGRMGLYVQQERDWGAILKEHTLDGVENLGLTSVRGHGLFHDDVGIYKEDAEGNPVYDFTKSDEIFDFFVNNGIEPIVELAPMPSALASDPTKTVFDWKMGISPPKDFKKWQDLIRAFVQHSVDRYGMETAQKWYYEVWNEPECCKNKFWSGTLNQYFELYDHTAAGVRAVLPEGRMGGPVSSQSVELTENSMAGKLFLDHVTAGTNYALPDQPVPLDFFAYHTWSFVGGAVDGYFDGLDLLDSYGLTSVPIAITEFGPTWEFGLFDEPQEMSQGAAFVAQVYSDVARRAAQENRRFPITHAWWVLSDVFDEGLYREEDPFIGCMGLTSREGIKKPAYNVYKFLAQMGDEQLTTFLEGPGDVGGMATTDGNGGVQVLLYHGQDPGNGPNDDKYYTVAGPQDISVLVDGLNPEVAYDITEYRVDDTNGNAYAVWQGMERPTMAAMTTEQWDTLRNSMESKPVAHGEALCGTSFRKTVSLGSPGVVFLKFTPAVR